MNIKFPMGESWDFDRDVVLFPAEVDGSKVVCAISWEALQDNFGGNITKPLDCFNQNRSEIERKAESLIRKDRFEPDGSILIRSSDGR